MLYIRYLIIMNGQQSRKKSENLHFWAAEGGKLLMQFVRTSGTTGLPTNRNIGAFSGPMALATRA